MSNMTVAGFVNERCELSEFATCQDEKLYKQYVEWCVVRKDRPASRIEFGRALEQVFSPGVHRAVVGGVRLWRGLGLTGPRRRSPLLGAGTV